MKMRAAVLSAPGQIDLREVPAPTPGPGQLRIRVESCGVCSSNIPPYEGRPWFNYPMAPGALGHEGTGRIHDVGAGVAQFHEGERVAFLSYHSYAEYDIAETQSVVPIPPELETWNTPGEPLGCAMNIFERSAIKPGDLVAIVGVGFLGALLTQLAAARGAKVIVAGRRACALEKALHFGALHAFTFDQRDAIFAAVNELSSGKLCDVVIEATGKQAPLDLSSELTRERGRLIIAGYHQDGTREVNMQLWNWRGFDVINAHERDASIYIDGMRKAVSAMLQGALDPRPLITHLLPLENLGEALELTRERPTGFMKAIVRP